MRHIRRTLLVLVFAVSAGCNNAPPAVNVPVAKKDSVDVHSDLFKMQLHGKVFYYVQYLYDYQGDSVSKCEIAGKEVVQFNEQGNFLWQDKYYGSDSLVSSLEYKYNDKNKLYKMVEHGRNFKNDFEYRYHYDAKGNNDTVLKFDGDGKLFGYLTYSYDQRGLDTMETFYHSPEMPYIMTIWKKNGVGRDTEVIRECYVCDLAGPTYHKIRYDSTGNIIRDDKDAYSYSYFDGKGNWQKRITYDDGRQITVTVRRLEYDK